MTAFNDPFIGLPTPSDTELEAMDARPPHYAFNGAVKLLNINSGRERFHHWAGKMINLSIAYDESTWRMFYLTFVQFEDAADLLNTQACACDRYENGRDESFDPNLDAFV